MAGRICVEVIQAWPRRFESETVRLSEGATVADAITAARLTPGGHVAVAVHGEKVASDHALRDGDRVELLRPLALDPKEARRRRAEK
jgi:uncharacterized protein